MDIEKEMLNLELRKEFMNKVNALLTNIDSSLKNNKCTFRNVMKISIENATIVSIRDPEEFLKYALKQMNHYIHERGALMIHDGEGKGMEYYGILDTMIHDSMYGSVLDSTERSVLNTIYMSSDTIVSLLKEYRNIYKIAFTKEDLK